MALSHSPLVITSGLVLYLDAANPRSYPGSGTTWFDLSGNGNNGSLTGGPTFNSANGGNIVFDGVDDYIILNTNVDNTLGSGYTLSIWVKPTLGSGNALWNSYNGQGGLDGMTMGVSQTGEVTNFLTDSAGHNYMGQISSAGAVSSGAWFNIVGTWRGSFVSSSWQIFVNGILLSTSNYSGGTVNSFDESTDPLEIGRYRNFSGPTGYLNGLVSNAQVYNRPLSNQEIIQNFNATRGRFGI